MTTAPSLSELFDNAGDGVVVIDADFRIVYWNKAAEELLGYSTREAVGALCHDVIGGLNERGGLLCGPDCSLATCARHGDPVHSYDMQSHTRDGRPVWLSVSTLYLRHLAGHRDVIIHLLRNVDELKRSQHLVRQVISLVTPRDVPEAPVGSGPGSRIADLTEREREVLAFLSRGLAAKGIAARLRISQKTARNHIQSILSKLDAHSQLEAVLLAQDQTLI